MQLYAIISTFCTKEQLVVALLDDKWVILQMREEEAVIQISILQQSPKNQKAAPRRRCAMDGEIARTWPVVLKYFRIFGLMLCVLHEAKEKLIDICYLSIPQWSVILVCFYKKENISSNSLKQQLKKCFSVRQIVTAAFLSDTLALSRRPGIIDYFQISGRLAVFCHL